MKRGIDYIGIGIGAVIIKNGKIFLSKRGRRAQNEKNKWECPGGALEFNEGLKQTVVREIREEFGITVKPVAWLEPYNHRIPNEKQHWVALAFVCRLIKGKPKILEPDKSAKIGWFSPKDMEKLNLTLTAQKRLKQIRQKYPHGLPY